MRSGIRVRRWRITQVKTLAPIIDGLQYKRAFNLAGPSRPRVTVPSSS
ncbi:hypothetical protein [Stenotrophomonas sp. CASM110]